MLALAELICGVSLHCEAICMQLSEELKSMHAACAITALFTSAVCMIIDIAQMHRFDCVVGPQRMPNLPANGCCDLQWVNNANYVIPNVYLLAVPCSWQSPIVSTPPAWPPLLNLQGRRPIGHPPFTVRRI